MENIVERLRAACDRTGKPSGAHMIDGQRMIMKHFRLNCADDEAAQSIADVAECMADCIENEALLFECLKTEAIEAATTIEKLRSAFAKYGSHIGGCRMRATMGQSCICGLSDTRQALSPEAQVAEQRK